MLALVYCYLWRHLALQKGIYGNSIFGANRSVVYLFFAEPSKSFTFHFPFWASLQRESIKVAIQKVTVVSNAWRFGTAMDLNIAKKL